MAEKEKPTFDPDLEGRPRQNLTKKKDPVKMEIDRRSPNKVTPKSVTNNPKATPKSVTNNPKATIKSVTNNPKATPKSVTKVSPKSVINDPTVCPKPDKNINTPPLPSPAQNPPTVVCEATSKITPRRSPRLTPSKRKVDGRKSPTNPVELVVVKPVTTRKLVQRKNTRGAVKARKENKSSQMNIFSLMIESSLPQTIMIAHDLKTFGVYWESRFAMKPLSLQSSQILFWRYGSSKK
ncbi:hypothetical protein CUMW_149620, partial [Citrus unshiu]